MSRPLGVIGGDGGRENCAWLRLVAADTIEPLPVARSRCIRELKLARGTFANRTKVDPVALRVRKGRTPGVFVKENWNEPLGSLAGFKSRTGAAETEVPIFINAEVEGMPFTKMVAIA